MLAPDHDQEDQATNTEHVEGFKYLKLLNRVLHKLHDMATQRDWAGNRQLHFDQYVSLLLLYFFSPSLTSLRAVRERLCIIKSGLSPQVPAMMAQTKLVD